MIIHITFFFILSFITSMFSIANAAYDSDVIPINIIGTIIFLLGICLYSYYNGFKKDNKYFKSLIIYGVFIGVVTLLAKRLEISTLNFFLLSNILPLYSITHTFKNILNDNIIVIYSMEILLILVSYISGNYISNKRKS